MFMVAFYIIKKQPWMTPSVVKISFSHPCYTIISRKKRICYQTTYLTLQVTVLIGKASPRGYILIGSIYAMLLT